MDWISARFENLRPLLNSSVALSMRSSGSIALLDEVPLDDCVTQAVNRYLQINISHSTRLLVLSPLLVPSKALSVPNNALLSTFLLIPPPLFLNEMFVIV